MADRPDPQARRNSSVKNSIKKIFIIVIVLICCVAVAIFASASAFGTIEDEGFAMPASTGIEQSLAGGGGEPVALAEVKYDDVVYKTVTGYFVGEDRSKIDIVYPLYINGGAGIRFLGEENWLITKDVELYETFHGLYVSEGISYNVDMTQADTKNVAYPV